MKRLLFLLLFAYPALAQVSSTGVRYVGSAPSGSCAQAPPVQVLNSSGAIYTCDNGTWAVQGGGGGGTPYPSGTGIPEVTAGTSWGTTYNASNPIPANFITAGSSTGFPVQLATTGSNITLTGEQSIDGVTTSSSTVLVKDQTTASQNGCYISGPGSWSRCSANIVQGAQFYVAQGGINYNTSFTVTTANPITVGTTALNFYASVPSLVANPALPCDILSAAGTPCVAAHSMTRKMLASYSGNLFQIERASDSTTLNVGALSSGIANVAAITTFCAATTCTVTEIYDQMGTPSSGNNLPQGTVANQAALSYTYLPNGLTLPIIRTINGYAFENQYYRNRANTVNMPTGNSSITEYMVVENFIEGGMLSPVGTYGDEEATVVDGGAGHMFALAYSTEAFSGSTQTGIGPWTGVDLENGVYSYGLTPTQNYISIFARYSTSGTAFTVKNGDATQGRLTVVHSGSLPAGYTMNMEGGISLGEGGDASPAPVNFLEGVVVAAATTDVTDAAVQANLTGFYGPGSPSAPTFLGHNNILSIYAGGGCTTSNLISSVFIGPVQSTGGNLCAALNITQGDSLSNYYMRLGSNTLGGVINASTSGNGFYLDTFGSTESIGLRQNGTTKLWIAGSSGAGVTLGSSGTAYQSVVAEPVSSGNASPAYALDRPGVASASVALDSGGDIIVGTASNGSSGEILFKTGVAYNADYGSTGTLIDGYTKQGIYFGARGSAIASASTIAPITPVAHVTGVATISTITAPTGCTTSGYACQLTLIPDGLWATTTGGNIALATIAVVSRALIMTYDPATTSWYPSY